MTEHDELLLRVAAIIRDVMRRPGLAVTFATTAREVPGWDSLAMISIIIGIQDAFGIEFETRELDELNNVGDLVQVIAGRLQLAPD